MFLNVLIIHADHAVATIVEYTVQRTFHSYLRTIDYAPSIEEARKRLHIHPPHIVISSPELHQKLMSILMPLRLAGEIPYALLLTIEDTIQDGNILLSTTLHDILRSTPSLLPDTIHDAPSSSTKRSDGNHLDIQYTINRQRHSVRTAKEIHYTDPYITLYNGKSWSRFPWEAIIKCVADKNYTLFYLDSAFMDISSLIPDEEELFQPISDNRKDILMYHSNLSISEATQRFPAYFVRINRSTLINRDYIRLITMENRNIQLHLRSIGETIIVGKTFRSYIVDLFGLE